LTGTPFRVTLPRREVIFTLVMPTIARLRSNLWKLSVLRALHFAWFIIPTIMIFYQNVGLTIQEGLILKTILSVSIFVFEVPSGTFADLFGRKNSLVAAGVASCIGTLLYLSGDSFSVFACAEILSGLAVSLISGADSALAYDSMAALESEGEYVKVEGRLVSYSSFSEGLCGIIGAYVASYHTSYPFVLQLVADALFLLVALLLVEVPVKFEGGKRSFFTQVVHVTTEVFIHRPVVRLLTIFSSISAAGTFLVVWLSQMYMEAVALPVRWFGIAWAVFHGIMGVVSLYASQIEDFFGSARTFWIMTLSLGGGFIALAAFQSPWGITAICALYALRGIRTPLLQNHLNSRLSSDIRATALSLQSFLFRLIFVVLGPITGLIIQNHSLSLGFLFSGIVLFFSSLVVLLLLFQSKAFR
jgi:predicted MFS family arabinose efflux permease